MKDFCWSRTATLLLLITALALSPAFAQPYIEKGDTRFSFAQMYLGLEPQWFPPEGFLPSFIIGGTHFWGHADFYVKFPFLRAGATGSDKDGTFIYTFSTGIGETGGYYYPWRLEEGGVRPFIGLSWAVLSYQQERKSEMGPRLIRHRVPLKAGASWLSPYGLLELGGQWIPFTEISYPVRRGATTTFNELNMPSFSVWLAYKYLFDTTIGNDYEAEQSQAAELAGGGKLNSAFIGIGPSAAFPTTSSPYNNEVRPYLDGPTPAVFPEFGIGYYHYDLDAVVNLAYRFLTLDQSAYGTEQNLERNALTLEAFKFLFDYHGFDPFVGVNIGSEWLRVTEKEGDKTVTDERAQRWVPGLTFGWDIRPTDNEWFYLRTTLRYLFNPGVDIGGKRMPFDQLEFNFIQFVFYFQRLLN